MAQVQAQRKKSPDQNVLIRGYPFFIPKPMNVLIPYKDTFFTQAGLLTYGLSYSLRLPIRLTAKQ
jgi:hypothetical protein